MAPVSSLQLFEITFDAHSRIINYIRNPVNICGGVIHHMIVLMS